MSDVVFPGGFAGLKMQRSRSPRFATTVHTSVSGREYRNSRQAYPLWDFKLSYEVLRERAAVDELRTIAGFFLARRGMLDSFRYADQDDNAVTDQVFAVCDGVTRQFQLVRAFGYGAHTFLEPVMNVDNLVNVKRDGVTLAHTTSWTVNSTGLVTLTSAGAAGQTLTWTGSYWHRCRFLLDVAEFEKFCLGLWSLNKLEFRGAVGNKV